MSTSIEHIVVQSIGQKTLLSLGQKFKTKRAKKCLHFILSAASFLNPILKEAVKKCTISDKQVPLHIHIQKYHIIALNIL